VVLEKRYWKVLQQISNPTPTFRSHEDMPQIKIYITSMYSICAFGNLFVSAHLHMYFVCFYVKKRKKALKNERLTQYTKNRRLICNVQHKDEWRFLFNQLIMPLFLLSRLQSFSYNEKNKSPNSSFSSYFIFLKYKLSLILVRIYIFRSISCGVK